MSNNLLDLAEDGSLRRCPTIFWTWQKTAPSVDVQQSFGPGRRRLPPSISKVFVDYAGFFVVGIKFKEAVDKAQFSLFIVVDVRQRFSHKRLSLEQFLPSMFNHLQL